MKTRHVFAMYLLAAFWFFPLRAQSLEQMEALWNDHKYSQVLPLLASYWNTQPNGKNWRVGFMIGSSECQTDELRDYGVAMLEEVLAHLKMPDEARPQTEDYLSRCRQRTVGNATGISLSLQPILTQNLPASVVGMGKGGFILLDRASLPSSTISVTPVPETELLKHLYPLSDPDKALAGAIKRLAPGPASGAVVGHFVVVAPLGGSSYSRATGECLQKYEPPLEKQFGMNPPGHVVSVYLAVSAQEVGDLSRKLHGLQLALGTVAYSVYSDLSIVGLGGPNCGSLGHELVHLLIRGNFGDCPPWLEEGLASEVAVTSPLTQTFEFGKSWRDDMLAQQWHLRPTVEKLLQMDWSSYVASRPDQLPKVAAIHAMAAVFVRYLAANGQLGPVYLAFRDHGSLERLKTHRTDRDIVQMQLGKSVDAIDADFVKWFNASTGHSFSSPANPANQ